jgi:peptidoglycan/xylan/chitin deacetylase (PgdA/CDA1 family)
MALAVFGFTTAASAQVVKKPYAVVSLTFDDAPLSVYTQAYPLLKAARLPATVYVSTAFVGLTGYLKWTDIKALDAGGWEIGAHTHAHLDLTTLPSSGVVEEITKSQTLLRERGFKAVSFSAPYGAYGERELAELKKVYTSNRAAWGNGGINNYHRRDAYNLVSLPVTLDTTVGEIREQIQTIKKNGGWLILQFHQIDNGQDEPAAFSKDSPYMTKKFPETVKVILEEQVPVRTVRDIIENP